MINWGGDFSDKVNQSSISPQKFVIPKNPWSKESF